MEFCDTTISQQLTPKFPTKDDNFPTDGHICVVWGAAAPPAPPYSYATGGITS